jgi:hypothetical protein
MIEYFVYLFCHGEKNWINLIWDLWNFIDIFEFVSNAWIYVERSERSDSKTSGTLRIFFNFSRIPRANFLPKTKFRLKDISRISHVYSNFPHFPEQISKFLGKIWIKQKFKSHAKLNSRTRRISKWIPTVRLRFEAFSCSQMFRHLEFQEFFEHFKANFHQKREFRLNDISRNRPNLNEMNHLLPRFQSGYENTTRDTSLSMCSVQDYSD